MDNGIGNNIQRPGFSFYGIWDNRKLVEIIFTSIWDLELSGIVQFMDNDIYGKIEFTGFGK